MAYLKPQSPIKYKEDYIYPPTTIDQIIMEDGQRLSGVGVYLDRPDATDDTTLEAGINADTLGGILASDYALKTGTVASAENAQTLGGKAPQYYIQPRNLLDNSDFTNPVNQRGQTSYTGAGYTIDRWKQTKSDVLTAINSGYIEISHTYTDGRRALEQIIPNNHIGETLTVAVCDAETGNVYCKSVIVPEVNDSNQYLSSANFGSHSVRLALLSDGQLSYQIMIGKSDIAKVRWVALYEGEYTADTLPPYVPKGYGAELAECQRYYLHDVSRCTGQATSTVLYGLMPTPVQMRTTPSVTNLTLGTVRVNTKTITASSVSATKVIDSGVRMSISYESTSGVSDFIGVWVGSCSLSADL